MLQEIIIGLLFTGALGYAGRLGYRQFFSPQSAGCAKGCGGCSALDVNKLQQQIQQAQAGKAAQ